MISAAEALAVPLLAALPEQVRARVVARAADVNAGAGEYFLFEGDPASFWVVLDGEIEVIVTVGGVRQRATTFDPGEFFGEVPLMLGAVTLADCRALRPSRLARIDPLDFHLMITECPEASTLLAQTLVRRVGAIRERFVHATLTRATIVGDRNDLRCHDLRDVLSRTQIPFEWLDPSEPVDRASLDPEILRAGRFPLVVVDGRQTLVAPTLRELAEALGLQTRPRSATYDVAIVGGGPAGLAAAVYGGSEGLRTILIEREAPGGQAGTSSRIENYLGFPGGISGSELAQRALQQARRFGAELMVTRSVAELRLHEPHHEIVLDGGESLGARAIVIATGVCWRALETEGAAALVGRGIYYGAARTEALGTRGRDIFLIGGGNSAGQAAMFFANYARSVTLLVRGEALEASMSYYLIEQLRSKANIAVEVRTTVVRALGEGHLEALVTRDGAGSEQRRPADDLFVFIGADAQTDWLPRELERDQRGYLRTGRDLTTWSATRAPFALETSVPGVFAAGDVRSDSVKRVASGVGEGSMVIAWVHRYFEGLAHAVASI